MVASVGGIDIKYISLNIESLEEDPDKKIRQVVKSKNKLLNLLMDIPATSLTIKY